MPLAPRLRLCDRTDESGLIGKDGNVKLSELIAELEELAASYGDADPQVMAQHQPSYPLREVIRGVVDSKTIAEHERQREMDEAAEYMEPDELPEHDFNTDEVELVVYVVIDGHPYEGTPYGDRVAFDLV